MPIAKFRKDRAAGLLILARGRIHHAEASNTGTRADVLATKRSQIEVAAHMAKAVNDSKFVRRQFDRLAREAGVPRTRAGARPHIRLLKFLRVHAPGGSLPRHSDQIDRLLRTGLSARWFGRLIIRNGLGKHRRRARRARLD